MQNATDARPALRGTGIRGVADFETAANDLLDHRK
jgi:hypothetical protein